MLEQNNSFGKGMNRDVHPSIVPHDSYYEAKNAVMFHKTYGNTYSLNNEPGFIPIIENLDDFGNVFVIGMCPIDDDFIVFCIRLNNPSRAIDLGIITDAGVNNPPTLPNSILINPYTSSEVGLLEKQPNSKYRYKVIVNDKDPKYWSSENEFKPFTQQRRYPDQLWNFDIKYQIDCTARRDFANRRVVYWTDGKNYPRYLVIDRDYTDDENKLTFEHLEQQTRLIDTYNYPYIKYNRTLAGGELFPGVYQFAARYLNATYDPTTFGYICPPIPVVDDFRWEGRSQYDGAPFDAPLVPKSLELVVSNVDTDYEYLEVAVIFYRGPANQPVTKIIGRYPVTGPKMKVTFDGTFVEDITLAEILRVPVTYNTAEHIIQKDNRLFLSNLTTNPVIDLQKIANRLRIKYIIKEIPFNEDESYFEDYKEENNTFDFKGYKRGEVYSFAIVGLFKDGSISFAHHIPGPISGIGAQDEDEIFDKELQKGIIYAPKIFDNSPVGDPYTPTAGYFKGEGYLNPYISNEYYPNAPSVTANPAYYEKRVIDGFDPVTGDPIYGNFDSLVGKHIRHHVMPTNDEEPYIFIDHLGITFLRILGIQIEGIKEALDEFPEIKRELKQILVVREQRNTKLNKSVYAQGCINKLMKHVGRTKEDPVKFKVDYKLGLGDIAIDYLNHLAHAVFAIFNPLYTIGLRNLEFNARIEPYEIQSCYFLDPYWGNTQIKAENGCIFYNGFAKQTAETDAGYSYYSFDSPEPNFIRDFYIPLDATIKPIIRCTGKPVRVSNSRTYHNHIYYGGHYNTETDYPWNAEFKAPYFHVFVDFNSTYRVLDNRPEKYILNWKRTRWNDLVVNNGNIYELTSNVINVNINVNEFPEKVNNYENEGYILLHLVDDLESLNFTQSRFVPSNDNEKNLVFVQFGAKFNILFAPYLPLWLLQLLKDASDYGTPIDAATPLGVGLQAVVKVLAFIGNVVLSIAVAALELVFIRGAVVNRSEVKDEVEYKLKDFHKFSGRNGFRLGCESPPSNQQKFQNNRIQRENQKRLMELQKEFQELTTEIEKLEEERKKITNELDNYPTLIQDLNKEIEALKEEEKVLQREYNASTNESEKANLSQQIYQKREDIKKKEKERDRIIADNPTNNAKKLTEINLQLEGYNFETLQEVWGSLTIKCEDLPNDFPNEFGTIPNRLRTLIFVNVLSVSKGVDLRGDSLVQKRNRIWVEMQIYRLGLKCLNAGLDELYIPGCQFERFIYEIKVPNEKQYGPLGSENYILVDVLFSEESYIENYTIHRLDGQIDIPPKGTWIILGYDASKNQTVFAEPNLLLKRYDYDSNLTPPLFNGDTFITKYFWKNSYNIAYRIANIGQNNLNRTTLKQMYMGGPKLIVGPVIIPIPNFLAFPGSVFAASVANDDGKIFAFLTGGSDPDIDDGIESVAIKTDPVYDPLFPVREGSSLRGANYVWLESSINCQYRHRPVSYIESAAKAGGQGQFNNKKDEENAQLGVPYYPKDSIQWCFEVTPEYGNSDGYNVQYSLENNIKTYIGRPFFNTKISEWRFRTIYSEAADQNAVFGRPNKSELSDKYRIFLPLSYQEIPKNKGYITGQFVQGDTLFLHSERSLWKTYVNTKAGVPTTEGELILGNGGVFQLPPTEMIPLSGGYGGCIHKWSGVNTPFGYIFVDYHQKKVFKVIDQLEDISQIFMSSWFLTNLDFGIMDNTQPNYYNNPVNPNAVGIAGAYDPLFKRYILSIRRRNNNTLTIRINNNTYEYIVFPTTNFSTISFLTQENFWVSLHSYCLSISKWNDLNCYSFSNLFRTFVRNYVNSLFLHNVYVGKDRIGNYGVYYNQTYDGRNFVPNGYEPFELIYVINEVPNVSKVFDNIVVQAELIDEITDRGIRHYGDFFNTIRCYNDEHDSGIVPIILYRQLLNSLPADVLQSNCKIYNDEFRLTLPPAVRPIQSPLNLSQVERYFEVNLENIFASPEQEFKPRLKGKYLFVYLRYLNDPSLYNVSLSHDKNLSFVVNMISNKFRLNIR